MEKEEGQEGEGREVAGSRIKLRIKIVDGGRRRLRRDKG